jgi:hypothetical protein
VHKSPTGYLSFTISRQTLNAFLISFKCATWPLVSSSWLQRYLLCNCLLSPVISSLLGSHFILSSQFVNTVFFLY